MQLQGASWPRQLDAFFAIPELDWARHGEYSSSAARYARLLEEDMPQDAALRTDVLTSSGGLAVKGDFRPVEHQSRDALCAGLQRLSANAHRVVAERWFLRWGLYAVRRAALRRIQRRVRFVLWHRVGARCFSWWRLVTERRLSREVLHQEADLREGLTLLEGICRVAWGRWRRWASAHARQRSIAMRLGLMNRQRHGYLRFRTWTSHWRQCRQLQALEQIRFSAERSLAYFALIRWRLHTLEDYLAFPLQVRTAQGLATAVFRAWQRRAQTALDLKCIYKEVLYHLARSSFDRWKRWRRRRLQAALLREANAARLRLRIFLHWAWHHQLRALDYERCVGKCSLPRLFS
ncbi:hypothetical protein JKF63_01936 [Porcisia hertigi]|uniref:Sfi1 spindle body domain-containing protein n=1 Tax=Porcisia hertigi TaxID=2761500 RepID=A0A836HJ18_9TRYP|nr:hypothetical protein JKF63_01936 [Porcisia hertigi]